MTYRLVLASASPRRADVLRQLGLDPEIRTSNVDETRLEGEEPADYVERLARAKASELSAEVPNGLIVGGDTIVVDGGVVLGKPDGPDGAKEMLTRLAGGEHFVLTGLAIAGPHGIVSGVSETTVRFRSVGPAEIDAYVATEEPLDKAGAYGIQGLGAGLVASIDGDYYTVVGFPVGLFLDLLSRAGWRYDFGALTPRAGDDSNGH